MTDDSVVTLYEVSKRIGLRARGKSNWNPLLISLCGRGNIDVRIDDAGSPCCREGDIPRIAELVEGHFNRPRIYRRK